MQAATHNDDTLQQAVIRHTAEGTETFRFILYTDGSGKLVDISYGETLDISHDLNLADYAADGAIVLTNVRAIRDVSDEDDAIDEYEVDSSADGKLSDEIGALFDEHNDLLENPVGDAPEDEELTVSRGETEDLYKALAAIVYLGERAGLGDAFAVSASDDDFFVEGDEKLTPILEELIDGFGPTEKRFSYIDQNDGRVSAYAESGPYFDVSRHDVDTWFPSARERLEAKSWLRELFSKMELNVSLIDETFTMNSEAA
jgi:hypothetical protein